MKSLKVGDVFLFKQDLVDGKSYNTVNYVNHCKKGDTTIVRIFKEGHYELKNGYYASDEMYESPKKHRYTIGDKFIFKSTLIDNKMYGNFTYYRQMHNGDTTITRCIYNCGTSTYVLGNGYMVPERFHKEVINTIEAGDLVKYIGPRKDKVEVERPYTTIVQNIHNNGLTYMKGKVCGTNCWKLLKKANTVPTRKYNVGDYIKHKYNGYMLVVGMDENGYMLKNRSFDVRLYSYAYVDDPLGSFTPQKSITKKENTMPEKTTEIEIKINGEEIQLKKHQAAACLTPKTDLEKRLPYAMITYSATGKYESSYYNKTLKGLKKRKKKFLQDPTNLGKTVTLHKFIDAYTTAIPVVKIK